VEFDSPHKPLPAVLSEEKDGPILHESVRPQTIPAECYQ